MNRLFLQLAYGLIAVFLMIAVSGIGSAAEGDYPDKIKPVFRERCYSCHGALKQKAGLRVDTVRSLLEADVVVPGKVQESELFKRITSRSEEDRMPPEGHALTASQVATIALWIENGATAPDRERPEDDPLDHWSFQKIEPVPVSEIQGIEHPIDAFLAVHHRDKKLIPQTGEERSPAIRRLYFDLIGLPPTPEQLSDSRSWDEIVEELLRSPHHGERWGRHWMDVWRYSDWYGLGSQLRYSQKHLWHWRDWIVESLNADKGYDQMIREMLAGDEIAPGDADIVRATGFLARNYFLFNRTTWLDNTIEHTGKAFLGLTLNCAKCHDHKYDPVDMVDYYSLRAIFEPHQVRLDPVPGFADLEKNGLPRVFDDQLDAATFLHLRGDPKKPDKETKIFPAVPAFLSNFSQPVSEVSLPVESFAPGSRKYAQEDRLASAAKKLEEAEKTLAEALRKLKNKKDEATVGGGRAEPGASAFVPVRESFASHDSALWKLEGSGLEFRNGTLEQTSPSQSPGMLIFQKPLPRDFEMICRYTTTGGPKYRSVTFRFDRDDDGKNSNFIYTSEQAPGAKVQAAYTREGRTTYPPDGRTAKNSSIGQPQELHFAVRDTLVNVWLDGKFVLSYRFPDRRDGGRFSLSAFDATAIFHSLELRPLSEGIELKDATNKAGSDAGDLKNELALAKLGREAARAELDAVRATIAADRFRYAKPAQRNPELEKAAARAQALASIASAEVTLAGSKDDKKKKAAQASKKEAREKLLALENGMFTYSPLKVSRKALETPKHKFDDYPAEYSAHSTGRRTMLAHWITSPENPLTARVAVNHVWMRHFGEPLVETVFDFGRLAKRPDHLELLDYLASEFIKSGWSFRHLHRLMVTSRAYRRTSSSAEADSGTKEIDPGNRYYWRMNSRRMESQLVRDSLLHLTGELDLTVGGPSIDSSGKNNRRSLYFTHSPEKLDKFLATFDDADLLQCYRRSESVVPQQALALSNSELSLTSAEKIARRIEDEKSEDSEQFIKNAFSLILARFPERAEVIECLRFLDEAQKIEQGRSVREREIRARTQLVHALLNHNDFITIR